MTEDQISISWAFCRGDLAGRDFEKWLFGQDGLEEALGEDLHWSLLSGNYNDREEVWALRAALASQLRAGAKCECSSRRDLSHISMAGDFEREIEPLERLVDYGPDKWWLYISRCGHCEALWLIAQDERIYDDFFLNRIDEATLDAARAGRWPERFSTYEDVLKTGRRVSTPPRFFDLFANSLLWTVEDLRKERVAITVDEMADMLGLSVDHAAALVRKVERPRRSWRSWFSRR